MAPRELRRQFEPMAIVFREEFVARRKAACLRGGNGTNGRRSHQENLYRRTIQRAALDGLRGDSRGQIYLIDLSHIEGWEPAGFRPLW